MREEREREREREVPGTVPLGYPGTRAGGGVTGTWNCSTSYLPTGTRVLYHFLVKRLFACTYLLLVASCLLPPEGPNFVGVVAEDFLKFDFCTYPVKPQTSWRIQLYQHCAQVRGQSH